MRTQPKLDDLHPWLRERVVALAGSHRTANPGTALCLIWGIRSAAEQQKAYKAGRSKINGTTKFSLHQYGLAADLWVYTEAQETSLYENRPPKRDGLQLQLLQRGSLRAWYIPMGYLAEMEGLEAGALWRTFRDGPHVQVPKHERIVLLQDALNGRGFNVGDPDGAAGPKTRAGIRNAAAEAGLSGDRNGRLMPVRPELWHWIVGR
ncbi:L-alanyl-D-glutamate peptidase [uncultured Mediterranean phage]|nr:L-alanyl-D-glutamate peptidase [uncultured Mediterranean phage]